MDIHTHRKKTDGLPGPLKKTIGTDEPNSFVEETEFRFKEKEPFLKCRYLFALMGFLVYFQMTCYRLNTSISIVAMVNNTMNTASSSLNSSSVSCPSDIAEEEKHVENKIGGEFNWSPKIQGYILGASFLGYLITQMPGAVLAEKYSAKTTVIMGVFISSVCQLISPLVLLSNSNFLIATQFIRGLGQGVIPAATCVLSANWIPRNERGLVNTITVTGFCFGALVGGVATGALCSSSLFGGWPSVHYIFGGLGIVFALLLQLFLFESPKKHPRISDAELKYILQNQEMDLSLKRPPTPWRKIFTSKPVYAMTFATTGQFWALTHFETVHPIFLGTILHYPIEQNGLLASLPFVLQILFAFVASWISDWLGRHQYAGVDKVRKGCNFLFCILYSACLLGIYAAGCDKTMSAPFSVLAMGCVGLSFAGCLITAVDMSPSFAGTIMGASSIISSLSGFVMPILVGFLTNKEQTIEQWNKVFFISIGVVLSSGIVFVLFGSADVQSWNFPVSEDPGDKEKKINQEIVMCER